MESDTTSHLRPSLLTSFLSRGSRPRSTAASPTGVDSPAATATPGGLQSSNGPITVTGARRRNAAAPGGQTAAASSPIGTSLPPNSTSMPGPTATSFSQMLRRRRSNNGNLAAAASNASNPAANTQNSTGASGPAPPHGHSLQQHQQANGSSSNNVNAASSSTPNPPSSSVGPAHRIRLVPHLDPQRALHFDPIVRECREGAPAIRIGRFTDRSGTLAASTNSLTGKIAFKSKVVSRGHAELWCEPGGKFYVKDTSSSSGTFLNHMRLSHAGVESRPFLLKDGDILQLGVDYQGGTEEIYRCVKIRVEIGREWQAGPNPFNTNALAQLKSLSNLPTSASAPAGTNASTAQKKPKKSSVSDCCICLFPVTVCQALFIAPCSHSFHYKCIRGTLVDNHPGFSCPLCRSFHDLEADVEVDIEEEEEWEELPEPAGVAPAADDAGAEADGEADVSAAVHHDHTDMEIVDMGMSGHVSGLRRSMDDDDDAPHGFRTAAEDNGRSVLLPQGLRSQNPALPPATSNTTPRRTSRRNMTHSSAANHTLDEIDRGFETDGGVIGLGAETDMDLDEPTRGHNTSPTGHMRTGSGRNRSTIYNLVHGASNSTSTSAHPAGSGTVSNHAFSGMSSAPNLLRPGSSTGHHAQYLSNNGSGVNNGTVTPPHGSSSTQPYPIRSPTHQSQSLMHSSSNSGVGRAPMSSGSLPSGSSNGTHLFGDSGAGPAVPDKDRPVAVHHLTEDGMLEERPLDANASGFLGFGSKRKR